jgi:hypothetical protein
MRALTDSSLFLLNLCNDYRALQRTKANSGVTKSWLKQNKTTTLSKRRNESDDDSDIPEAALIAASKPIKKRVLNSGVAVISQAETVASRPPSKKKLNEDAVAHDKDTEQGDLRYGGLEEEDDNKEWETIRQSPVKGKGVRRSDAVRPNPIHMFIQPTNILACKALVKVESPAKPKLPKRVSEWNTDHLPDGAIGKWRKFFVTTFAMYIGTLRTPWEIRDRSTFSMMQECWDFIYKDTPAAGFKITGTHNIVFVLVSVSPARGH